MMDYHHITVRLKVTQTGHGFLLYLMTCDEPQSRSSQSLKWDKNLELQTGLMLQ